MPPPNLSFVNPVLSLCCTFEFQPEGSGRWSTRWSRPIREGLSASTATASSTTFLWIIVHLSLQSFTQLRPLPLWRGKTRNWWRMRAATQWTGRSVQPEGLQRDSHILSSGPRAGRDTAPITHGPLELASSAKTPHSAVAMETPNTSRLSVTAEFEPLLHTYNRLTLYRSVFEPHKDIQ